MKNSYKILIFYIVLIAVILIAATAMFNRSNSDKLIYSDIVTKFKNEEVKVFEIDDGNNLTLKTQDGTVYSYKLRDISIFYADLGELIDEQHDKGIITDYDYPPPIDIPWWVSLIPYVIIIVLMIALWVYVMNQATGRGGASRMNSFGRARVKLGQDEKKKVYFKDVAGCDEEKEELREVVDFLRDPTKFTKLGARIPHGILLVGPPGTGKTLLAKAVAGEAGVPFFSISGSDFVEMYVGVGASRVRDLFEQAKKNPASIIFIDEIDAVGRHRGAGLGGGHDEREQTLNQLLVEMDGFGSNEGIIVMAATNRPDILDPALLRPGRFDRQVTVSYPDIQGREAIIRVHAEGKPFDQDVDFKTLAKSTVGFTGADLANLLNEAALLAARKGKNMISNSDLEDATLKVIVGPEKKAKVISDHERTLTAYHEAGHAVVTMVKTPDKPVHRISIVPSGRAGGYTMSLPKEDRSYQSRTEMENEIVTLLAGRVAESLKMGDISTGASNDISRATQMARSMVMKYGMSDSLGPILYGSEHTSDEVFLGRDFNTEKNYSEETAAAIDAEIKRIVESAYAEARRVLIEYNDKLEFVAGFLRKNEVMEEEQFDKAMNADPQPTYEELEEMNAERRRRIQAEQEMIRKHDQEEHDRIEAEDKRRAEEEHNERTGGGVFPPKD
ncbi:MAG: ATP-dependent zinc metalloprotease FtsH [Clostridiales bacterium]|nr:ATP-dependent zinc metalloprotease FtsH [Clostridiales bacterium]